MPSTVPATLLPEVPGLNSKELILALSNKLDGRAIQFFADYVKSHDNFIVDVDGNEFLDVYAQIASNAVGYNNETVLYAARSGEMASALSNRPALGVFPSNTLPKSIEGLLRIAPPGHNMIFPAQLGNEVESSLHNEKPGSPELAILSFKNAFHGRGFGSLSTTRSKAIHKLDIPSFNWPVARFPALKYPLKAYLKENEEEVRSCLVEVDQLMSNWHFPVAGIIVEPIQSEGGDNHAPASFFQGLQDITKKHGAALIVDEVQTGFGATGKFWAHEHWKLRDAPDMVTFAKKAQTAGYFFGNPLIRLDKAYRQFNTWISDEARFIICNAIVDEILDKNLVEKATEVGNTLYVALEDLATKYPHLIRNLRGKGMGTFIAFDTDEAVSLTYKMKLLRVNIGNCGKDTIRLRPMLIFQKKHIPTVVEAMEKAFNMETSSSGSFASF